MALSTLHHVIDLEWMKEAYRLTRKDGAPGIDGVTAADYGDKPGSQSLGPPGSHQVGSLQSAAGPIPEQRDSRIVHACAIALPFRVGPVMAS